MNNTGLKSFKVFLASGFAVVLCAITFSCASQKKDEAGKTDAAREAVLVGMVRIYGNEPHTWVGIDTGIEGKVYSVEPLETARELRSLQGNLMEFKVRIRNTALPGLEGIATMLSWRILQ